MPTYLDNRYNQKCIYLFIYLLIFYLFIYLLIFYLFIYIFICLFIYLFILFKTQPFLFRPRRTFYIRLSLMKINFFFHFLNFIVTYKRISLTNVVSFGKKWLTKITDSFLLSNREKWSFRMTRSFLIS